MSVPAGPVRAAVAALGVGPAHLVAVTALAVPMLAWMPEWCALPDHGMAVAGGAWLASYSYVLLGTVVLGMLAWTTADRTDADALS